jgi:LPS O-antigen subunit length determinant protein (WzzB/FepE family)
MGQQQLLLIILGIIIVGFAIAIGISLFSAQKVTSNRDAMINDIHHLAWFAYQYRISLRTMGGGEGDYTGFTIPLAMQSNNNGNYSVADIQNASVTIKGISAEDSLNTISVTVDGQGKLGNLTFSGDF